MSLVLELPAALEAELTAESERLGVSVSEIVVRRLNDTVLPAPAAKRRTGAECLAVWDREAVLGIRQDIDDPAAYVREMRSKIDRRVRDDIDGNS